MGLSKRIVRAGFDRLGFEIRRKRPPARSAPLSFPADYDSATAETIRAVAPYTMTSIEKLNALCASVRYLEQHRIPGAIVECGVFRGGSMMAAARTLLESGSAERDLYLFDTFEGMVEPDEIDRRIDGRSAKELFGEDLSHVARAGLDDVSAAMDSTGYPRERLHFVKGRVEDTIPDAAPDRIALLRLDTDWYASTRHELEHLFHRVPPGGVLIIDDYGAWQGAKKAVDEFIEETNARLLLLRIDDGRIAIVP